MTLAEYMEERRLSDTAMADLLSSQRPDGAPFVHRVMVRRWRVGLTGPSLAHMAAIERATGFRVTAMDMHRARVEARKQPTP